MSVSKQQKDVSLIKIAKEKSETRMSIYRQLTWQTQLLAGWNYVLCKKIKSRADVVANQVEKAWLIRYPLPKIITVDRGKELLIELKTMITNNNRIPCSPISVRNLQANTIVERVHQTIGNKIGRYKPESNLIPC